MRGNAAAVNAKTGLKPLEVRDFASHFFHCLPAGPRVMMLPFSLLFLYEFARPVSASIPVGGGWRSAVVSLWLHCRTGLAIVDVVDVEKTASTLISGHSHYAQLPRKCVVAADYQESNARLATVCFGRESDGNLLAVVIACDIVFEYTGKNDQQLEWNLLFRGR